MFFREEKRVVYFAKASGVNFLRRGNCEAINVRLDRPIANLELSEGLLNSALFHTDATAFVEVG
jgi:hypothetical protein